jgi:hypothetical protein
LDFRKRHGAREERPSAAVCAGFAISRRVANTRFASSNRIEARQSKGGSFFAAHLML